MKLDKRYYQDILEEMAKRLLKERNRISQLLDKNLKESGLSFYYESNDLDIKITFKKKEIRRKQC